MSKKRNKKQEENKQTSTDKIKLFYDKNYKILLVIPLILFFLSLSYTFVLYNKTGDIFIKDISLKGGSSITLKTDNSLNIDEIETYLINSYPDEEFSIRGLEAQGKFSGLVIDTTLKISESIKLIPILEKQFNTKLNLESSTDTGSVLGESFFKELSLTLLLAFFLMGSVVFLYFRNFVPSFSAVICVVFDMVITLGIINLLQIKISSAGIAAFLMLIGYSIDTDILLTTKVLKRIPGVPVTDAIFTAMKTGLTMSAAGITATIVAFLFSNSIVIKQIMIILIIGLIIDILTTWLQNAGLLKLYFERKEKHE